MTRLSVLTLAVGILALTMCPPVQADCAVRQRVVITPAVTSTYVAPAVVTPTVVVKKEVVLTTPVAVYVPYAIPVLAAAYPGYAPVSPAPSGSPVYPGGPGGPAPPAVPVPIPGSAPAPGAGGLPGSPLSPAAASGADMRAIMTTLERINARLDVLEGKRPPPAMERAEPKVGDPPAKTPGAKAPGVGKLPAVFGAKCAQCHQRGNESKGGEFVMLEPDGTLAKLEAKQLLGIARKVYLGQMPPKSSKVEALSDSEVSEIIGFLDTLK